VILIAGPCVIESKENVFKIAKELVEFNEDKEIEFYFKASFDKANRTSIDSFRGPGLEEGLKILDEVKKEFGFKILTDVHESYQPKIVSEVAEIIQIPAFLCRQTDLLVEAAKTKAKINIKKAQFLSADAMKHSLKKVLVTRGYKGEPTAKISKEYGVFLTERGNVFGYGDLVVDMRNLVIMREFAPVIFDATHSVQKIAGANSVSAGNKEFVKPLAKAAAAVGVDGFFFETHFNPSIALSDGANMVDIEEFKKIIKLLKKISLINKESYESN